MLLDDFYKNPEQYVNVLYFSDDPELAARQHCDKHVAEMIIACCRILSAVWAEKASDLVTLDWTMIAQPAPPRERKHLVATIADQRIYAATMFISSHPSVAWASLYGGNYEWLWRLGMALLSEYTMRFDRIHACTPVLRALETIPPSLAGTLETWCDAPSVVPPEVHFEDTVTSYREYYRKGKTFLLCYARRVPPEWIADVAIRRY